MSRHEETPEQIYIAHGETEAQLIRAKLESYDIPSVIISYAAPSVHVFVVDGMGEYRVMVPHALAGLARQILEGDEDV